MREELAIHLDPHELEEFESNHQPIAEAGMLGEIAMHVKGTVDGLHTLEEFAEFYCLREPGKRVITTDAIRAICEADGKAYALLISVNEDKGTTQFTTWGKSPEDKCNASNLAEAVTKFILEDPAAAPLEVYEDFKLDAAKNKAEVERLRKELATANAAIAKAAEEGA